MLLKLTSTFADGRTKPLLLSSDVVKEISVDDRAGSPSKSILFTKDGHRYYLVETVEQISEKLG